VECDKEGLSIIQGKNGNNGEVVHADSLFSISCDVLVIREGDTEIAVFQQMLKNL
jgi:hypothetical protein